MTNLINKKIVNILLIEDNQADIRLITEVLKDFQIEKNIVVIKDGEKASEFLFKKGEFINAETPDIILLDLNIPKKDGFLLLKEIKGSENLKNIPVIVITTSDTEESIKKAYELGANCYIVKPLQLDEFIRTIKLVENFWINIVKLP